MDSFELNKIAGAILGALLFVMGVGFLAEAIYEPIEGRGGGYELPEPAEDGAGAVAEEEAAVPLGVLLAAASAEDGEQVARKCASCHNFEQGAANKTGPGLYNIVGHEIAAHEGFAYSDALQEKAAEVGTWDYESLNAFLTSPKAFAPGTKMSFAGLRSEKERANLLAYLQTLSDSPVPFPAVVETENDEGELAEDGTDTSEDMGGEEGAASTEQTTSDETMSDETSTDETSSDAVVTEEPVTPLDTTSTNEEAPATDDTETEEDAAE